MALVTQRIDASTYVIVLSCYVGGDVLKASLRGFGGHGGGNSEEGDDASILEG